MSRSSRKFAGKLFQAIFVLSLSVFVLGCKDGSGSGSSDFHKFGTAPVGAGAFNSIGGALCQTLNENGKSESGSWTFDNIATKGTKQNIRDLAAGDLTLGMANASIAYLAAQGKGEFDQAMDIQAVMTLGPNFAAFVTTASSGIKTMADLKGKKVMIGPAGAGFDMFVEPILNAHGIKYDDITKLDGNYNSAADGLSDGSVEAAFMGGAIGLPALTTANANQDIVFIPLDASAIDTLVKDYPFFAKRTIPAKSYSDLENDYPTIDCGSIQIVTSSKQTEDLIYKITKTIYENRVDAAERFGALKAIEANASRSTGLTFHPGAKKFYDELAAASSDSKSDSKKDDAKKETSKEAETKTDEKAKQDDKK